MSKNKYDVEFNEFLDNKLKQFLDQFPVSCGEENCKKTKEEHTVITDLATIVELKKVVAHWARKITLDQVEEVMDHGEYLGRVAQVIAISPKPKTEIH